MFDFDNWRNWTSFLLSHGQPKIRYKKLKEIERIPDFIVSIFWSHRYEDLEGAVFNLKNVLNDFIKVFYQHVDEDSLDRAEESEKDKFVWTKKFYKIDDWNPELYHELLKKFNYHTALVDDLTLEMTRAANLVIEKIRKHIYVRYREEEGKLLVTSGPFMDMSWKTYKVEYMTDEKKELHPYHGLKNFMTERENRDMNTGEGVDINYLSERFEP